MAITQHRYTVGTTAVRIDQPASGVLSSSEAQIRNLDAAVTVQIGDANVTADDADTTGGFPIYPTEVQSVTFRSGDALYARVASGTARIVVLYME